MGKFWIVLIILAVFKSALAGPATLTYQGRIIDTSGRPLENSNISFEFAITNPSGTCILFKEQLNGVDLRNSNGVFDTPIGAGTKSFPPDPSVNLVDVFSNSASLQCEGGSTYNPVATDGRLLRVQFYDGKGWKLISPDNIIRSVPYANQASNSMKLGNKLAEDFVLKTNIPTCATGYLLTSTTAGVLTCAADTGGSSGSVNSISGTGPITVAETAPNSGIYQVSAAIGTTASTLVAGNDSRILNSLQIGATAGGGLAGTYPNPSIADNAITSSKLAANSVTSDKILNGSISLADLAPGTDEGQVFRYNGTTWSYAKLNFADLTNATGNSPWPSSSCAANQFITWVSVSDGFSCTSLNSSMITSALGFTPLTNARTLTVGAGLKADGTLGATVDLSANRTLAIDVGTGANQIPQLDALGKIPNSVLPSDATLWSSDSGNVYRSTGKVGIGTTTPAKNLDIQGSGGTGVIIGDSTGAAGLSVSGVTWTGVGLERQGKRRWQIYSNINDANDGTNVGTDFIIGRFSDSGAWISTPLMIQRSSGNVGIGTITPSTKVEVIAADNATAVRARTSANLNSESVFYSVQDRGRFGYDGVRNSVVIDDKNSAGSTTTKHITMDTAGSERLRITSAGEVGIGTTTPWGNFEVVAPDAVVRATGSGGKPSAIASARDFGGTSIAAGDLLGGLYFQDKNTSDTGFLNNIATILGSIDATGGTTRHKGRITFNTSDGTNVTERLRIDSGGNVGIGTTSPTYKLDVNGSANFASLYINGVLFNGASNSNGVSAGGGQVTSVTQTSTDAASGARSAIVVQNNGTGGANEYNFIAKNAAGTTTSYIRQDGTAWFGGPITTTGSLNSATLYTPFIYGGNTSSQNLTLESTSHATKGSIVLQPNGGKVGIGTTTTPDYNLTVTTTQSAPLNGLALGFAVDRKPASGTAANGISSGLVFRAANDAGALKGSSDIHGILTNVTDGSETGDLVIRTRKSGTLNEVLRITSDGNLGVHTSTPKAKLDVSGAMAIRGRLTSGTTAVSDEVLPTQGAYIGWNENNGSGRTNFMNHPGVGGGGFEWNMFDGTGAYTGTPMMISNLGFVGIGTSTPTEQLTVSATTPRFRLEDNNSTYDSNSFTGTIKWTDSSNNIAYSLGDNDTASKTFSISNNSGTSAITQIAMNNSPVLTVLDSGNVGIGTTNPGYSLDIVKPDTGTTVRVINSDSTTAHYPGFSAYNYQGSSGGGFPFLEFQNLGGTSASPAAVASGSTAGGIGFKAHNGTAVVDTGRIYSIVESGFGSSNRSSSLTFLTAGTSSLTEKMRITSGGNVGIGTTSPTSRLEVKSNSDASIAAAVFNENATANAVAASSVYSDGAGFSMEAYSTASTATYSGGSSLADAIVLRTHTSRPPARMIAGTSTNIPFHLMTANTNRLTIDGTGNVGIGTASPGYALQVSSATNGVGSIVDVAKFTQAGGAPYDGARILLGAGGVNVQSAISGDVVSVGNTRLQFWTSGSGTLAERMRIDTLGRVGIGTTSPTYTLDVAGDVNASGCLRSSAGTASGTCASDERLKTDIQKFDLGLDALLGITPHRFKYNGLGGITPSGKPELGVLAQEVEKTAPELIVSKEVKLYPEDSHKTQIKQVNYTAFTYVLINSVKELYHRWMQDSQDIHREMASLKSDNAELKKENSEIKAYLCAKDPGASFCRGSVVTGKN
ncbi:hypothetical protein AZI86_14305 [Bdellovibrio bacteriovorus]|uniref:Peptidase S74 domain-containing protein n=1 Tax=Bdellovibrio bacteriovorus TaxID=959 RepID=A0A150WJN5_BDEBC|nr:tail fiber domain-containing protein [Bdellovibrio bacteriovorus]KYG63978.1 hypothetical protein AZI86_14305 [Bdellovibrio bacteriovorus]